MGYARQLATAFVALLVSGNATAQEAKLTFATLAPPNSPTAEKFYRPWAQQVEQRSAGTLKIEFSEGYALANFTNALDRLLNDVIQITAIVPSNYAGKFPLTEVGNLPFTADTGRTAGSALWRTYRSGVLNRELQDFVPIALYTFGVSGIHLVKKPTTPLEDLRGLRITVASRIQGQTIAALGGAPLVVMPQDVYEGLHRGMSDGIITSWNTFGIWKYHEVTSYHLEAQFGTAVAMVAMTRKKYDSLAAEARRAIDDSATEEMSKAGGALQDDQSVGMRSMVARLPDHTISAMTGGQTTAWRQKTASILDEWAGSRSGGRETLDAYLKFTREVSPER